MITTQWLGRQKIYGYEMLTRRPRPGARRAVV
jgi:hypothetical protein